jgi:signal transduction histidine kinase|tara:strand:- start:611 stop:1939 length:1329 start_codon:yes stop_codon:yes gene_type:complete
MSLRLRLTILVAAVFIGFWLLASVWMVTGLSHKLDVSFDKRLESTAIMLSNILAHVPQSAMSASLPAIMEANEVGTAKGLTCQISSLHGSIIATSNSSTFPNSTAVESGFHYIQAESTAWRTFTLITSQHKITIADKVSERDSLYYDLLKSILIPPALAILITLGLLWFAIGTGIKPIMLLTSALEKRGSEDLAPIQIQQPLKELQPLINSQNALMARLAEVISREKQFTSNAAHELRTPLAGILAQAQLAELTTGDKQQRALLQVSKSTKRLNSILDNLFLLANIEASTQVHTDESWSVELLIKNMINETTQGSERIAYSLQGKELISVIPSAMIAIVCRNLIDNALKYSPPETPILMVINATESLLSINVSNTANVNATDIAKMTTRFWRSGSAEGAGLGLSIVETISTNYKGSITLTNNGNTFVAQFSIPLAANEYAIV